MVNWGETELKEELDVRSWLLKDAAKDDIANGMKDAEKMKMTSGKTGEEARVLKTMKQLELSWKRHMNQEEVKEDATEETTKAEKVEPPKSKVKAKSKMTKKMALKKAAEGSKNIMDWIRPTARQVVDMDWSDDVNIPVGESIITIKRKEEAKREQESWRVKMMCKDEVESLISHVEGRSVAGQ